MGPKLSKRALKHFMFGASKSLISKALNLSYFTIIYNIAEGILSIFAGLIAGSISIVGFGLDSAVESLSAIIFAWRFIKHGKIDEDEEEVEERTLEISQKFYEFLEHESKIHML